MIRGYYQLVEGHAGGFMFTLRAGNHETILQSRVYWSRQAALDAVDTLRRCSQDGARFITFEDNGAYTFEVQDEGGRKLGASSRFASRAALNVGMSSVQRNALSTCFRGLVRRMLTLS